MPFDVSSSLPDLDLEESSVLTIDTGDAGSAITQLVIHVTQDVPELPLKIQLLPPLFAYEANGGAESPGLTR